jgi:hypothetical protein
MANKSTTAKVSSTFKKKAKVRRPGVHSKKSCSCLKTSKNYVKPYRSQGKK